MSMKPNYFKIGLFVIIAFILIIVAVVVFGTAVASVWSARRWPLVVIAWLC